MIPPTRADRRGARGARGADAQPAPSASPTCARSAPPTSTGERRVAELVERLRRATRCARGWTRSSTTPSAARRAAIAALPDGDYEADDVLEGGPRRARTIELRVAATVDGERLRLDFTGTADQVDGNLNCPLP